MDGGFTNSPAVARGSFQIMKTPTPPGFHNTMITSVARVYEGSQKQGT